MSVVFPNLESLKKYIKIAVNNTLQDEVVPNVQAEFYDNAEKYVYGAYDPFVYVRQERLYDSGTYSVENGDMETTISVDHPYGELIEYGQGTGHGSYNYLYNRDGTQDQYLQPRSFYGRTVEKLNDGWYKELLINGLKTYGIDAH